ncbi:MAG: hypothetical protein IPL26_23740 [Leptospiraceae bacterium]|nr:hypothetical protein [Leptospiraceae bacterium]MBP7279980.1 hypothetical protein [Leptospiraceae bacterium]
MSFLKKLYVTYVKTNPETGTKYSGLSGGADDGTYSPEELSREIYMEAAKKLFGILSIFFLLFTLYHLL